MGGEPADGSAAPLGALISDRWELVEHIGEGGMSDVFKARHVIMNKFGAVKFLKGGLAEDPVAIKRFQQEALASGTLSHPNIVQVYDCGLSPYGVYLIMEMLEGVSLSEVLEARAEDSPTGRGILQVNEALSIFVQICDGLESAHKKGIVHRDIKPSNVMLVEPEAPKTDDPDEVQVKLVDFGIAKMVGRDGTSTDGSLTRTGEVFGSPLYMSPEQCLGRPLDGRADIYSLGCLMYECLTGGKVLSGGNSTETMMRHVEEEADVSPIVETNPQAKALARVVQTCLRRSPSERYADVGEVRTALLSMDKNAATTGNVYGKRSGHTGYMSLPPQNKSIGPLAIIVSLVVLVTLAAGGIFVYSIWPVANVASVAARPLVMPIKTPPPPKKNLAIMSPRLFDGGEGIVARLKLSPERKRHNCIEVLRKADQALALKHFGDANRFYAFVFNIVQEAETPVPGGWDLLLHASVGRIIAKSEMTDLDQLDINLGTLIKTDPAYFNASNREKRFALQKRATVQIENGSLAAAAVTIKEMLACYEDEAKPQAPGAGPSSSGADVIGEVEDDLTQKAIWKGMLADLLRLTQEKDAQSQPPLNEFAGALSDLEHLQISDTKFSSDVMIFKARLYYRYGLVLAQAQKYVPAYRAFLRSLAIFQEQGGLLVPEMEAARVQTYLALKHIDPVESLKYRLQNRI
ncbi:MAG: serine/threonine protein kinase [Cyanobacteria bacterium SZAS TMP-1]|nr:serine/threonine protein kinase [Cyanobacteria bacterium SZAS TMP-1]